MPSDQQLSDLLSDFARTMLTDFPIQAILDTLVKRIVDVMPIVGAGVTLISPGDDPRYVAASDAVALRFEELQSELAEGPCVAAVACGEAIGVPDLRSDGRFPKFATRAIELGLVGVFTFPLRHRQECLGALDLYRDVPGPLDEATLVAAQTLADVAAAYLINAEARAGLREAFELSRERALHDPLTGLPNRSLLFDRLEQALARRGRAPGWTAVLFIDMDRFKRLNDSLGHAAGDALLIEVGRRFVRTVRSGDTVARFGGDEFVVLSEDLEREGDAVALAGRLAEVMRTPVTIGGSSITVSMSIGIAVAAAAGDETAAGLVRDADAAMYQAKERGRNRYEVFDVEMRASAVRHLESGRSLRRALTDGELVLLYRPIIDLATGSTSGLEALVCWDPPGSDRVTPELLLTLAGETGMTVPIGEFALLTACRQLAEWNRDSARSLDLTVAVNLSAHELVASGLADVVERILSESALDPQRLCLEITESVLLGDGDSGRRAVERLKALGLQICVDDLGTGAGSLTFLTRFPLDAMKIDGSFIHDLAVGRRDQGVLGALVDLAHAVGLRVVADGVDTAEQAALLMALGCEEAQGRHWSGPLEANQLERWLDGAAASNGREPMGDQH